MKLTCNCGETSPDVDDDALYALGWRFSVVRKAQRFHCPDCMVKRDRTHIRKLEKIHGKERTAAACRSADRLLGGSQ